MNWKRLLLSLGLVLGSAGLIAAIVASLLWCTEHLGAQYAGIAVLALIIGWLVYIAYSARKEAERY